MKENPKSKIRNPEECFNARGKDTPRGDGLIVLEAEDKAEDGHGKPCPYKIDDQALYCSMMMVSGTEAVEPPVPLNSKSRS
jgi:hypothetical protein